MKKSVFLFILILTSWSVKAQKIDTFFVNLYTDSLKKGTHNYINVDGKLSSGGWLPLTTKELKFTTDNGYFEGNSLVLPQNPSYNKVTVSVSLISDSKKTLTKTIWIKQKPDPVILDTENDLGIPNRKTKRSN